MNSITSDLRPRSGTADTIGSKVPAWANRRATGPRFACRSSYIDPWFYKPAPRRGDDPGTQFSGAPSLRLPGDPVEVGPENMEESAHSVASVLEKEEVLDRMLTRLALTDDPKLETVLPKILPYSISCLSSGSPAIRKKVKIQGAASG